MNRNTEWTSKSPNKSGYWWVKYGRLGPELVEVDKVSGKWQWSHIRGITWNVCKDYPKFKWAGPVTPPK